MTITNAHLYRPDAPVTGMTIVWRGVTYRVVGVLLEDRHGEGREWYVDTTRWIKSTGKWSGRIQRHRWKGMVS